MVRAGRVRYRIRRSSESRRVQLRSPARAPALPARPAPVDQTPSASHQPQRQMVLRTRLQRHRQLYYGHGMIELVRDRPCWRRLAALALFCTELVGCGSNGNTPTSPACTATSANVGPLTYRSTPVTNPPKAGSPISWSYSSSAGANLVCPATVSLGADGIYAWTCPSRSLTVGSGVVFGITDLARFNGGPGSELVSSPIYNVDGSLIASKGGVVQCDGTIK